MSTVTESIGRVLAGRYRIESVLGTGASAHVFAARDVTLQRRVAIKVLHPALCTDGAFLRRFTAEARSAAALTHPHVLAVYDWGEDDSGPFLVLEFLGGGSLRDLLDAGRKLTVEQAVAVGLQASEGLAYAHARGFVHRDVKPANLLFDEEGRLRIADFGLARALAEAALTEPAGTTVGTARYAAPEQALGHMVDGRADVYSLALVLYEAVTGVVPFTADTTISTLMARVGASLPKHESLGPLGDVLERAAAPESQERLGAATFAGVLGELAARLPGPEPLPLAASPASGGGAMAGDTASGSWRRGGNGGSTVSEIDRTEHGFDLPLAGSAGSRLRSRSRWGAGRAGSSEIDDSGAGGPDAGAESDAAHALAIASAVGVAEPVDDEPPLSTPPALYRRRRGLGRLLGWKPLLSVAVLALAVAGAAFAAVQTKLFVPSHRLPTLTGLTASQASAKLRRDHLSLTVVRHRYSVSVPSGGVVRQIPASGTMLKNGSTVSVVISTGPPPVAVPSLAAVKQGGCSNVVAALAPAHLHADCLTKNSTQVPAGAVISWSPTRRAPEFSTIQVYISLGPPIETIPSLDGLTCAAATSTLQASDLHANCVNAYTTSGTMVGQVIPNDWSPATSAPAGSTVTVQISEGPPLVQVPAVTPGETVGQIVSVLQAAQLTAGQLYGPVGGTVFATDPSYPSSVPQGTSIDIYTN